MDQEKTIAEKAKPSKIAVTISIVYSVVGGIISFFAIQAEPGSAIKYCCLFYPFSGLLIMALSMGSIKFISNVSRGQSLGIIIGFALPAFIVLYGSLYDYDLLRYSDLMIPGGATFLAIFSILYITGINRKAERPLQQAIIMLICAGIYSWGAVTIINCQFDESPPMKFNTTVESKSIGDHKGNKHYMLTLTPWERGQKSKQIEVTKTEYEQTPVDGPVGGHIKQGYLHIRWFYLDL